MQFIVPTGLEQSERALKTIARFDILSAELVAYAPYSTPDAGLGGIGSRRDAFEERLGVRDHRRQLAPNVAAEPQAVERRQSLDEVVVAVGCLVSPRKGFHRFRGAIPARRQERVAI